MQYTSLSVQKIVHQSHVIAIGFFLSQWKALTEKRVSTSGGQDLSYADPTPNRRDGGDYKHSDFIPDGAHELLQCSNTPTEDEISWCASDEEGNVK